MALLPLSLFPQSGNRIIVVISPSDFGEGRAESTLPFDSDGNRRATVLKALDATGGFKAEHFLGVGEQDWMVQEGLLAEDRRAFRPDMQARIGHALYQTLFPPGSQVEAVLRVALASVEKSRTQLHIQLIIPPEEVQLAAYPWELAHDARGFLSLRHIAFSRYLAWGAVPPDLASMGRVNVLLISSPAFDSARGLHPLPFQERQAIRRGLEAARRDGFIHLDELREVTLDALRVYLSEQRGMAAPHVLHFDGHGYFGRRCNNVLPSWLPCHQIHPANAVSCITCGALLPEPQGYLVFAREAAVPDYVSATEMGALLQHYSNVALVVLSACRSSVALRDDSVFNGIAQRLTYHQIPAVVAMQYQVTADAAMRFAERFYHAIGKRDALVLAMSRGREAMGAESNQWYRPVLYLRWRSNATNDDGQLFAPTPESSANQPLSSSAPVPPRPRQLRRDVDNFTGREDELGRLTTLLGDAAHNLASTTVVCAISGMAGVGKSALAIHAAHSVSERGFFPDAQLYADLRGDTGEPVEPVAVLTQFLRALDVDVKSEGVVLQDLASQYRTLLATTYKRTLLLLDNAHDAQQVEYLLPGHPGCAVVITSRQRFDSLGGEPFPLEGLDTDKAIELLGRLEGTSRVMDDRGMAKQIVDLCARLPLALRIAGKTLARKQHWSLDYYVTRLTDQRLELLELDHLAVRTSFMLSYQDLDRFDASLFRLLGLLSGVYVSPDVVAALLDCASTVAEDALERLVDMQLLQPLGERQYRFHELMFLFARWRLDTDEPSSNQHATLTRVAHWYFQVASDMDGLLKPEPRRRQALVRVEQTGQPLEEVEHALLRGALAWFEVEYENLVAVLKGAYHRKAWDEVWKLAASMVNFFGLRTLWAEWEETHELAVEAARKSGNRQGLGLSLLHLGNIYGKRSRRDKAITAYEECLRVKQETGDVHGMALALNNLATVYTAQDQWDKAIRLHRMSIRILRSLNKRYDEAQTFLSLGKAYYIRGNRDKAISAYRDSLDIMTALGDRHGMSQVLNQLANIYEERDDFDHAINSSFRSQHGSKGTPLVECGC